MYDLYLLQVNPVRILALKQQRSLRYNHQRRQQLQQQQEGLYLQQQQQQQQQQPAIRAAQVNYYN